MAATVYNKSDIIRDVKIILDLNETNTALTGIGDIDQLQTDDIIERCLDFALDRVSAIAPESYLDGLISESELTTSKRYAATSNKPGRYVELSATPTRVLSVYCNDWSAPVYEFITPYDEAYKLQSSPLEGVRGNIYDPVVALLSKPNDSSKLIIELFDTDSTTCSVRYVGKASMSGYTISMSPLLYQAYIYMVASLYYNTLLQKDASELMALKAVESLNININNNSN